MNFKILIILVILAFGISTGTLLQDNVMVWLQGMKIFDSIDEITATCVCYDQSDPPQIIDCPTDNGNVVGDPNGFCPTP